MDPLDTIRGARDFLDAEEAAYVHAERLGRQLDSELCPECPDPGLCMAERYCQRGEA